MNSNISTLVKEFSQEVITSKNAKNTLNQIYRFLKKIFPVDFLNLPIYDTRQGTLHYKAFVSDDGVMLADEKIKLSSNGQNEILNNLDQKITLINNTNRNPITIDIVKHMTIKEAASTLFILTPLDETRYGVLGLSAWGESRYHADHIKIMESIFAPVAGIISQILILLELSSQKERLAIENKEFKKKMGYRIIGSDSGLLETMSQVEKVVALDIPVLLTGETGVGKEVIANAIHNHSSRVDGPLVSFNCGAIPENLIESELFGYEKGAFTGAESLRRGYFEQADGGTVFMDEIGELSLSAQVKLLRFLQHMELRRIGGNRAISVDTRIIAATNRDIQTMVKEKKFRTDLWYRLNVFPIHIPPLRQRVNDIPLLAEYFARRQSTEMNLPYSYAFAPEAISQLQDYDWPGNIRELKNVIERALITSQGELLTFPFLSAEKTIPVAAKPGADLDKFITLNEMICQHIRNSLILSQGRVEGNQGAAELLGLHPSTLRAKMRKFGIRINRVLE